MGGTNVENLVLTSKLAAQGVKPCRTASKSHEESGKKAQIYEKQKARVPYLKFDHGANTILPPHTAPRHLSGRILLGTTEHHKESENGAHNSPPSF